MSFPQTSLYNMHHTSVATIHNKQGGNVLFLILIAVALFAALSYAVSLSMRSSGGNSNAEQIDLLASQISQYGAGLTNTMTRMRLTNGCSDNEFSFFHDSFDEDYTNPTSPFDNSCTVFHPNGGGVVAQMPPVGGVPAGASTNQYWYASCMEVDAVGISAAGVNGKEILLQSFVTRDICIKVNEKMGISNPAGSPPQFNQGETEPASSGPCQYVGNFTNTMAVGINAGGGAYELNGQHTGCYQSTSDNLYRFYHVLLAR